jgi:hypothetical protein
MCGLDSRASAPEHRYTQRNLRKRQELVIAAATSATVGRRKSLHARSVSPATFSIPELSYLSN